jgi:hypothetical protein
MVDSLLNTHFPMKSISGKNKYVVQGNLQPIELWSYVFPREHLDTVLRSLNVQKQIGFEDAPMHLPHRKLAVQLIRKALGLKEIPKVEPKGIKIPLHINNMQIVGLGIKEDYDAEDHEAL